MTIYPDINLAPCGWYLMTDTGYQGPTSKGRAKRLSIQSGYLRFYWFPAWQRR